MKKNIIALAVASAIAAPVAMADAPTVYGQANVAVDSLNDGGTFVNDRDSRLGVKGSEDLGNGLKAVYQMELAINLIGNHAKVAVGTSKIKDRNSYLGLAGGFGTVLIGRHDTPFKMSQPKDFFNDSTYADMGKATVAGSLGFKGKAGEVRANDVLAYVSPSFNGVKLVVAGVSRGTTNAAGKTSTSVLGSYSAAVMYGSTKKGLYLAGAYNAYSKDIDTTNRKSFTEYRLSAQYAVAGLVASAVYQGFDDGVSGNVNSKEGTNIQINVGYKMGALMPKFRYSMVDYKDKSFKDANGYVLGLDYSMSKSTTAYVEYAGADKNMIGAAGRNPAGTTGNKSTTAISVGLLHKF